MAITKQQKGDLLVLLNDRLQSMKVAVFVDFRGMTVASINNLRSQLFQQGMNMKVAKKTIMQRAFNEQGIAGYDEALFTGPTAIAFGYTEVVALAKLLKDISKAEEHLEILGGIVDNKIVGKEVILQLADLPSREELLAKLVGSMQAPIAGFIRSANSPLNGFVSILRNLQEKAS